MASKYAKHPFCMMLQIYSKTWWLSSKEKISFGTDWI